MSELSVIIPAFNGLQLLQKQIPTLLKQLTVGDEIVIVDDASTDKTVEKIITDYSLKNHQISKQQFTKRTAKESDCILFMGNSKGIAIVLVAIRKNQRFAKAVNTGVLFADNPLLFLLNTDAVPSDGCISTLRLNMVDESVFAVGCLEKEEKGVIGGKNKLWFERGLFQHSRADEFNSGETGWVSGGSGCFRRSQWDLLSGFDPIYFPAYWEDVDLSMRAKKRGWKCLFSADAIVSHIHESTNATVFSKSEISKMSYAHQQYFTKTHASFFQLILYYLWLPYWRYRM